MSDLEVVIGLEVHTQLKTKSKIFCGCSTNYDSPANTNICPVCCGYPGTLPVFNQKMMELGIRVSLALSCQVNDRIYFERKNYFYPDLPKSYQISQFKLPLGEKGYLELPNGNNIGITRVHMEEDAGKLIHKNGYSLVDFNRTGTPLLEIVSEPDIRSPQEASDYLMSLKLILQYIGVSDCDMEKGSFRCDANISLRKKGETKLGTKVELKNMNSFKGIKDGLIYEVKRQTKAIETGEQINQETRLWDEIRGKTFIMRTKEEAHDYRYFPDPDLLDFLVPDEFVQREKDNLCELPMARKARFLKDYGLGEKEIDVLIADKKLADFFEEACIDDIDVADLCKYTISNFLRLFNNLPNGWDDVKIVPCNYALIAKAFYDGKINNATALGIMGEFISVDGESKKIIISKIESGSQVSNTDELDAFVQEAIDSNKKAVDEYLSGTDRAIMFLVGQVMQKTKGKANPKVVKELLEKFLNKK